MKGVQNNENDNVQEMRICMVAEKRISSEMPILSIKKMERNKMTIHNLEQSEIDQKQFESALAVVTCCAIVAIITISLIIYSMVR
jgi:hypothetical protein